jgi:acyl-CoA dehydrogenase
MSEGDKTQQHPAFPHRVRGLNFFDIDTNLHLFLERVAPGVLQRRGTVLGLIGAFAGDRLDCQAEQSDQDFPPMLKDVPDHRTAPTGRRNEIHLNLEYEECQQELYKSGIVAVCFDKSAPESHLLPFVAMYMVAQSDIATGCPFAMTHPTAYVLDRLAPQAVKDKYLPEILRTDGNTAICGTWATERHSGSDIGSTVTTALKQDDGRYRLQGHNWFTSAFGFKKFMGIKTARVAGAPAGGKGLGLYLVPSHIDDDWAVGNNLDITHLKRKLGTRGLPTVEIDLRGALAYEIVPAGQGLKAMMTALGCSRAHNAMGAAGVMRRAYLEALCWASNRETFSKN